MDIETIRNRIWLIPNGIPLKLENMTISATGTEKLIVTGWTKTIQYENISKEKIYIELNELKSFFIDLTESFIELKDIIKLNNLTIEYHMAYDDYGKNGIGLCSEINKKINWYFEK